VRASTTARDGRRVTDPGGQGTSPQVAGGVRRAAEALAPAGYAVLRIEYGWPCQVG